MTNDGELAHRAMHPSYELARVYWVRVLGILDEEVVAALKTPTVIDGEHFVFDEVVLPKEGDEDAPANRYMLVTLRTGRYREVRHLLSHHGLTVSRLKRVAYGGVHLPRTLKQGRAERLSDSEIRAFKAQLGLSH